MLLISQCAPVRLISFFKDNFSLKQENAILISNRHKFKALIHHKHMQKLSCRVPVPMCKLVNTKKRDDRVLAMISTERVRDIFKKILSLFFLKIV